MKVSICITYYNQEKYVKKCLESVLAIDFPCDYEILIGDDGSNDNTVEIIKEYQNKFPDIIKLFINDRSENSKSIHRASSNRLKLAEKAIGDYITFLDGDDFYCDNNFIKESINILEKNKNFVACAFNFKYLNEDFSEKTFEQNMYVGLIKATEYISKGMYTPSDAIIFRNVLNKERLQLLTKINNFDDNGITIYFLQFGDLFYIDKPVCYYRQSSDSLWNSIDKTEQDILNALDYNLLKNTAPSLEKYIIKRQINAIKNLYKNKKQLEKNLSNNFMKYLDIANLNQDLFVKNLLNWNHINLFEKIRTILEYKKFKGKGKND